jgi:SpoVK/Ycf46/Vps4 family AAA+-type ATPase
MTLTIDAFLLVDLPNEMERTQILKLHLQGENVDPGVSIEKLAKGTPYYSGSDIKNLCIAAALNAVKESSSKYFSKIKASGDTVHADTAPIRILKEHHFDQARSQIAPSASEDMHSLIQIHKWDGLYGDGKHRKRHKGIGFNDTELSKVSIKA